MRRYYDQFVDVQRTVHGTDWLTRAFVTPQKASQGHQKPKAVTVRDFAEARRIDRQKGRNVALPPRFSGGVEHIAPIIDDGSVRI